MQHRERNGERLREDLREHWERHGPTWIWDIGNRSNVFRTGVALCLILFGAALFLSNLGLFPIRAVWDYWPLIIIVLGVVRGFGRPSIGRIVWSVFLVLAGVVIFLLNLGVLHVRADDDSWPLSLLVIGFGVLMLVKALQGNTRLIPKRAGFSASVRSNSASTLKDWAIFGSVKRRLETPDFEGGEVMSIFGNVEIDLRRAVITNPERAVTVDAVSIFGACKIRVPENWRLNMQGTGILGAFEDKSITANIPSFDAPALIVTGIAVFGSVEIDN